ncbi:MAG: hypothetical protein HC771_00920 [Synechococcales cyanobacterium CRU_2_2]|nr:hypothetical protein [Synechococcales cyanobacterium CRU_2_2]
MRQLVHVVCVGVDDQQDAGVDRLLEDQPSLFQCLTFLRCDFAESWFGLAHLPDLLIIAGVFRQETFSRYVVATENDGLNFSWET